jgi:hypothetical protein
MSGGRFAIVYGTAIVFVLVVWMPRLELRLTAEARAMELALSNPVSLHALEHL